MYMTELLALIENENITDTLIESSSFFTHQKIITTKRSTSNLSLRF